MRKHLLLALTTLFICSSYITGCTSTYYAALEKVGIPKRDLVKKRIIATQDSQENAKKQFQSALERFRQVTSFDGGSLEEKYTQLKADLEKSEATAHDLRSRIASVQDVSLALFSEWESELNQYSSAMLRRNSEDKLRDSRLRYDDMIHAMRRSEEKLEPALQPLRDNVLYLKHNLNSRAIGGLSGELRSVEGRVEGLVTALQASIDESQRFIDQLER